MQKFLKIDLPYSFSKEDTRDVFHQNKQINQERRNHENQQERREGKSQVNRQPGGLKGIQSILRQEEENENSYIIWTIAMHI